MVCNRQKWTIECMFFCLLIVLAGCRPEVIISDKTKDIEFRPILETSKEWGHPVWLSTNHIFFVEDGPGVNRTGGSLYNLKAQSWQKMSFAGVDCPLGAFTQWGRLPDGRLGFAYECRDEELMLEDISYYLVAWEHQHDSFEILRDYPEPFHADAFAVAPDLTELIQETGATGISNKLYHVSLLNEDMSQILTAYYRAGSPSWSADGQLIAFGGNEAGPERVKIFDLFSGYPNLRNVVTYPWDLYVMEADRSQVRKVLPRIRFLDIIKWSPSDKNRIVFYGQYQAKTGLWLYQLEQKQLVRLWENNDIPVWYDWSPDGKEIILLDCERIANEVTRYLCTPTIITIPEP